MTIKKTQQPPNSKLQYGTPKMIGWVEHKEPIITAPPKMYGGPAPEKKNRIPKTYNPAPPKMYGGPAPEKKNRIPKPQLKQPGTQERKWGESQPGRMYGQVEAPGNPSYERRHPELNPAIISVGVQPQSMFDMNIKKPTVKVGELQPVKVNEMFLFNKNNKNLLWW